MKIRVIGCVCLCLLLLGGLALAETPQTLVRAKIGIKLRSGDEEQPAKVRERAKAGDQIQIYVIPEPDPAYIYVIHNDQSMVRLLNSQEQIEVVNHTLLKLPEMVDDRIAYEFDGRSSQESITIICSSQAIPEIAQILNAPTGVYEKWLEFEQTLIDQSQVDLSDEVQQPLTIGGTVRGAPFKLTDTAFKKLKDENIPENILAALQPLKDQGFWDEKSFVDAIEEHIGKEQFGLHGTFILRHADQTKAPQGGVADPFLEQLQISSGKSFVVKKYEFRVKK